MKKRFYLEAYVDGELYYFRRDNFKDGLLLIQEAMAKRLEKAYRAGDCEHYVITLVDLNARKGRKVVSVKLCSSVEPVEFC